MANLKEIRTRISSVKSTRQITSAMKMVSAAKLKKAQSNIEQMRPYAQKLKQIIIDVSGGADSVEENIYSQVRPTEKVLIVPITSNKGLCGGFNMNIVKKAMNLAADEYSDLMKKGNVDFYCVGKKGNDILKSKNFDVYGYNTETLESMSFENTIPLAEQFMNLFAEKKYDKIVLLYNRFINAASQVVTVENFLPIVKEENWEQDFSVDYIFEPSKEYILQFLIPKSLKLQVFKALSDSYAGEHGARMTAMHQATDNATSLLGELNLQYNKARQASITNEILEIVSGAEALKK